MKQITNVKIEEHGGVLHLLGKSGDSDYSILISFMNWEAVEHLASLLLEMYNNRTGLPQCVVDLLKEMEQNEQTRN